MTDCSLPFRRSAFEHRGTPAVDRQLESSISRTTEILSDANGSAYRVSRRLGYRAIRKILKVGQGETNGVGGSVRFCLSLYIECELLAQKQILSRDRLTCSEHQSRKCQ
ncbi:MAG: hypothetical protein DMG18_07310 [Acidobacteria bacterium]|nr:MAG: hypothetical protein DMG18_07310 [Acidobacteriota bacterium]